MVSHHNCNQYYYCFLIGVEDLKFESVGNFDRVMSIYGFKDDNKNRTSEEAVKKDQDENIQNKWPLETKDLWIWAKNVKKLEEVEYFNSPCE